MGIIKENPLPAQVTQYIEHIRSTSQVEPIERNGETWVWVTNCNLNGYFNQTHLPPLIERWQVRVLLEHPSASGLPTDQGLYVNVSDFFLYRHATAEIMEGKEDPSSRYRELLACVGEEEERGKYLKTEGRRLIEEITRRTKERIIHEALQAERGFWHGEIFYITFENVPREDAPKLEVFMQTRGLSVIFKEGAKGIDGREVPNCLRLFIDLTQEEGYRNAYREYLKGKRLART